MRTGRKFIKRLTSRPKWKKVLGFWILFFGLAVWYMLLESLGLYRAYLTWCFGILLIAYCVLSTKGRIKRGSYFLSLSALLFLLAIFGSLTSTQSFIESFFLNSFLIISYFGFLMLYGLLLGVKFINFVESALGLEIQSTFIRSFVFYLIFSGSFYPFVILKIKRLRDINLPGWLSLIALIPALSFLFEVFLCLKGSARKKSA